MDWRRRLKPNLFLVFSYNTAQRKKWTLTVETAFESACKMRSLELTKTYILSLLLVANCHPSTGSALITTSWYRKSIPTVWHTNIRHDYQEDDLQSAARYPYMEVYSRRITSMHMSVWGTSESFPRVVALSR